MREIAVTEQFDTTRRIGTLILVDGVEVPPDAVFAIGGIAKEVIRRPDGVTEISGFELTAVSLVSDESYIGYLRANRPNLFGPKEVVSPK